ncbi:MAG: tRNA (guanosine(37)-N1)-methyltransferase TrmD [Candidatus Thiodiazotropha lotti]|uniref:tRNA (guanine-N(1)-)-methyltransferase n=1 Tax=Candidatus Thiodiazotropha lotti TaxID=2792787 RepID=A0A9E4K681_9GAMM|nr:tRNA (guanosine(37)-N1)-methyltransferase TrmD [Candidatus Thiodiazotropha lotti]ODC01614.1 tRNA (guanosine(37)-N1)-methyltransferase TrmD [Candidatus Thiodiazotropha endoloripes]MCG7923849.1 tRNA (guanosine(37)-N1)-methyltransferase TrmD [Candidatus Thiodiazotropha lotti]MCG7931618.1 tRNA (guanosine(37)-N1)-methyltransferase TrmD [Candidatus Thiodiazotropha lotti]MCG7939924.1 tRNA (guanosine(37)-N1)-methyltransferase TrmD [Candidatus Thiodiazotropha lotti]
MRFDVVTLMPDMFDALKGEGVVGRAISRGLAQVELWNPRDYTTDVHRTVDDRPYGGGPGMVMKYQPMQQAIEAALAESESANVVYLSPQGRRFDQQCAKRLAESRQPQLLLAGRYEGIDERLIERYVDEEWSIGDYVLSGGELAAMVVIDAVIRLLPDVLGDADSAVQDSFMDGLLDCPHYTRPEEIDSMSVPPVLQSGNHEAIRRWRLQQALKRTLARRPELLENRQLTAEEKTFLAEISAASGDAKQTQEQ